MLHAPCQIAHSGGGWAADEAVPRYRVPSRGAEAQQGQQAAVGGVHEAAPLDAWKGTVAEIVIAPHMLVPQPAAGPAGAALTARCLTRRCHQRATPEADPAVPG